MVVNRRRKKRYSNRCKKKSVKGGFIYTDVYICMYTHTHILVSVYILIFKGYKIMANFSKSRSIDRRLVILEYDFVTKGRITRVHL